jgi:hypothetical protein
VVARRGQEKFKRARRKNPKEDSRHLTFIKKPIDKDMEVDNF